MRNYAISIFIAFKIQKRLVKEYITNNILISNIPPLKKGIGDDGDYSMLFMTMFQWEPGKTDEIMQTRMKENVPSGVKVIKEWVALDTNMVFRLIDTNDPIALLKDSSTWADLGYTEMHPVMDSLDAIKVLK
jgi:hypothetical protein